MPLFVAATRPLPHFFFLHLPRRYRGKADQFGYPRSRQPRHLAKISLDDVQSAHLPLSLPLSTSVEDGDELVVLRE